MTATTDPEAFAFDYGLLRELTEAHGAPGYEGRVRDVVERELDPHVDDLTRDGMGNLVGTVEGSENPAYEVVVAAHLDEIGFMVRGVTDDGFLRLEALGGWDPRVLRAQRVVVHAADGDLPGVIGSVPVHLLDREDRKDALELEDVHVDLGLPAEDVEARVAVGDVVTMAQSTRLVGEHVTGKALDNRVSALVLVELARRLDDPTVTVHLAATTQEEVGLRGAEGLGGDLEPDLALALDTTFGNDHPGFDAGERVLALGEGAGIKLKDASVITNAAVARRLRSLADDRGVPYQLEVTGDAGTDTGSLQRAGGATPVGALSVPTRYLHTVTECVHPDDVAAVVDLAAAFLTTETGTHDYGL